MTNEKLYEVLGDINEKHVKDAREYHKAKKPVWLKWGAMAACLCLVVGLTTIFPSVLRQETPEQHSTGAHLQFISTELVEWESNGFKGVVVYTGNSSLFPVDAKLTVIFREQNTEIILDDGTSYGYGEIQIGDIGWPVGSIIDIGFGVYEEYAEEKQYENKVYAYHVELKSNADDYVMFHGKDFNKTGLSQETLEWLERYNKLSETEQLAISSIPSDLYELCGYGEAEDTEANSPTE